MSQYDVPRIAEITRGIHPKDLLWIARSKSERLESAMTGVFSSVFLRRVDMARDSVGSGGMPYTLEPYGGGYLFTTLDKTQYYFDNDGLLASVVDVNGNTTTIMGAVVSDVTPYAGARLNGYCRPPPRYL